MAVFLDPENLKIDLDVENGNLPFAKKNEKEAEPGDLPEVKQRIKALKKIQVEMTKTEASFYEEMHELECKYLSKYLPFFEKRKQIILGEYEPTVEECDFVDGSESESEGEGEKEKLSKMPEEETQKATGIPDFWLTVINNVEMLDEMAHMDDEPVLKHLTDITVEMTENPMGFVLSFHFSPNEYFTNAILTKTYEMNCHVDEEAPLQFDGPEIIRCKGCTIDWAEGKNITVKTVTKKQKHKQNNATRIVSKTVTCESFFNFFSPPEVNPDLPLDEEIQMKLTADFEIGQYIRMRIIPRAVLYYTGEALEDDFDLGEEESTGSESEEDEEETEL